MSLNWTIFKAEKLVAAGQFGAAIKLYRGLLRMAPQHPLVNGLLGALLIQINQPENAIEPLEIACTGHPIHPESWVRLLMAHHRAGSVQRARELLELGVGMGVSEDRLAAYRKDLSEPTATALHVIDKMIETGNGMNAEIAARMLVQDYPESQVAQAYLDKVAGLNCAD